MPYGSKRMLRPRGICPGGGLTVIVVVIPGVIVLMDRCVDNLEHFDHMINILTL